MLAWFIPLMAAAGGMHRYFAALGQLWSAIPGQSTTLSSPWLAVARAVTIGWIFVVCFGSASVFLFRATPAADSRQADRRKFLWVWITPGLLFFTFVFLNYVNSGYLLVLSPPIFAFLAARVYAFVTFGRRRLLRWTAVAAGMAANCALFAVAPLYCSYRSIRGFERQLTEISRDFRSALKPEETLIVGFDSHFLGYRHAGYYLPEFVTVQYPEVGYADGKRVFVMQGQDTQVLRRFPVEQFRQFVIFPLPQGDEYTAYIERLQAKLPAGTLGHRTIGHRQILTGSASSLSLLFPSTTR